MMDYAYFDTSALIKRYVDELGRGDVVRLLRKNRCVVSAVLPAEVRSALRRRVTAAAPGQSCSASVPR